MGIFSSNKVKRWNKKNRSKFPLDESDTIAESRGILFDVVKDLFYRVYELERSLNKDTKPGEMIFMSIAAGGSNCIFYCDSCHNKIAIVPEIPFDNKEKLPKVICLKCAIDCV